MNEWRPWPWWAYLIRDLGFPMVVAVYVLYRLDTSLSALIREVHLLTIEVAKLGARLAARQLL